jgi:hypothetical protein
MNSNSDDYTSLIDGLGEVPPKWAHNLDLIVGELVDVDSYTGEYGSCQTLIIMAADGSTENAGAMIPPGEQRTVYASRTVLRNKVEKALGKGLKPGDRIAIKHFGRPEGRDYESYDLRFQPVESMLSPDLQEPITAAHLDDGIPF